MPAITRLRVAVSEIEQVGSTEPVHATEVGARACGRAGTLRFRMPIDISRRDLYERVWAEPIQKLSKEYGLSDVGLAKVCHRHNIPVPPRGYWAKKQAGKRVSRPSLTRLKTTSLYLDEALVNAVFQPWPK